MKKNFLKVTVSLLMVFVCCLFVACDPAEAIAIWSNDWYLKNETDSKLFYRFDDEYMQAFSPGENQFLYEKIIPYKGGKRDFNAFFEEKGYTTFKIYLEMDAEPVRVWSRDEAAAGGKQFWNKESWISDEPTEPANSQSASWIFEITPDDLK